jgi:ABC-type xylose transport system permease subunit
MNKNELFTRNQNLLQDNFRTNALALLLLFTTLLYSLLLSGIFESSRNLFNVLYQLAVVFPLYVALFLLMRRSVIDFSLGAALGFLATLFTIMNQNIGVNVYIATAITISIGAIIGLLLGLFYNGRRKYIYLFSITLILIFRSLVIQITDGVTLIPGEDVRIFQESNLTWFSLEMGTAFFTGFSILLSILYFLMGFRKSAEKDLLGWIIRGCTSLGILLLLIPTSLYKGMNLSIIIFFSIILIIGFRTKSRQLSSDESSSRDFVLEYVYAFILVAISAVLITARIGAANLNIGNSLIEEAILICFLSGLGLLKGKGSFLNLILASLIFIFFKNFSSLSAVDYAFQIGIIAAISITLFTLDSESDRSKIQSLPSKFFLLFTALEIILFITYQISSSGVVLLIPTIVLAISVFSLQYFIAVSFETGKLWAKKWMSIVYVLNFIAAAIVLILGLLSFFTLNRLFLVNSIYLSILLCLYGGYRLYICFSAIRALNE